MSDPDFNLLDSQLRVLLGDETDALANVSNFIALLYNAIDDIHWTGIYVLRDNELVLGPFQGKPACVRISVGSGVCGTAAATLETQRIAGSFQCNRSGRCRTAVRIVLRDTGPSQSIYLTRETYARDRVSTLITSF